jgi:hypothetical protein
MKRRAVRVILRTHVRRGLASQLTDRTPALFAITRSGNAVMSEARYRDYIN